MTIKGGECCAMVGGGTGEGGQPTRRGRRKKAREKGGWGSLVGD